MSTAGEARVGVVMGSDSDWPTMSAAAEVLDEFGVPFEADVVSAHRTPQEMLEYGASAHRRGLEVLIAGAGGAAHLPGMLAAVTPLPVIGVPVATVAIGNARNAGLLAVRMLAVGDQRLTALMLDFQRGLAEATHKKGAAVRDAASGRSPG